MGLIINPKLCVICKGRNYCGKPCYFIEMIKRIKNTAELKKREIEIFSTPDIFVGRHNYPTVSIGIVGSENFQDSLINEPKIWIAKKLSVRDVLKLRLGMFNPQYTGIHVKNPRKVEMLQEIAMSSNPVEAVVSFSQKLKPNINFSMFHSPIGIIGKMNNIELLTYPKADRKVEKLIDDELKASEMIFELYKIGKSESTISRILSAGLLGKYKRLVPTRWSITCIDDVISKSLINEIKNFEILESVRIFTHFYNGNTFFVLLFPSTWKFELIEIAHFPMGYGKYRVIVTKDYEDYIGRKNYAKETAGGYYASRLGVSEYLKKIKKQAGVLVVREILPEYWAPLGVWLIRESIRKCFDNKAKEFENVKDAGIFIQSKLRANVNLFTESRLLKTKEFQTKLLKFLT